MGRTSGSKNAADYFGGLRKAPSSDQTQPSGLRRFFGFLAPSNNRNAAEPPSARASASFLLPWRSTRGPADVLAVDQGGPSFDALQITDRWESVATDIVMAAREAPASRQGRLSQGSLGVYDDEDVDEEEEEDEEERRAREAERRARQRRSLAHQREDDYRPQPRKSMQAGPTTAATATTAAAGQQADSPSRAQARTPERVQARAGEREREQERDPREQEEQAQALRRLQMAKLQDLQRQATLREKDGGQGSDSRNQRLEYQPWEAPARPQLSSKQLLLPTPPPHLQQQQQQQSPPPKLEYSASARHIDLTPHPPLQSHLQSQSQKLLRIHSLNPQGLQHQQQPPQPQQQQQALLRQAGDNINNNSSSGNSRELLRLPPCNQHYPRNDSPALVLRERASSIPQVGDSPLAGPSSKSRRFGDIVQQEEEEAAAAAAGSARSYRAGPAASKGHDGDGEEDEVESELALLGPGARPPNHRTSFDRSTGLAATRSFRRGVFSDAGGSSSVAAAETGRPITPSRLTAGPSGRWQAAVAQEQQAAAAVAAAASGSVPPLVRRDSSLRFSVASLAVSQAPSSSSAAPSSVVAAGSASLAAGDNASPSRRTSTSGHDSLVRRTALLREACNGANSMRAKVAGLRTSNNGAASVPLPGLGPGPGSGSIPSVQPGPASSSQCDELDLLLNERSNSGQQQRDPSAAAAVTAGAGGVNSVSSGTGARVSNPGVWGGHSGLSVRVRHDLGSRAAAEEAATSTAASPAGGAASATPTRAASMPRWQEMLHAASAVLIGGSGGGSNTPQPGAGGSAVNSGPHPAVAADTDSSSSRSNSVQRGPTAAARTLLHADTYRDPRAHRPVTPAAKTGRVLQRANTQPAKLHSRFSLDESREPSNVADDELDGLVISTAPPPPPPPPPPAAPPAAAPPLPMPPASAVGGSPRAGRRVNGTPITMSPVPPPPRSSVPGTGPAPPTRRVSEANGSGGGAQQLVLPAPPSPVVVGAGGSPAVAAAGGSGGGASASPRVAALAERVRERSGAGMASGIPSPAAGAAPALDSPPLMSATPSFGRRTYLHADTVSPVSISSRLHRDNSPVSSAVPRPPPPPSTSLASSMATSTFAVGSSTSGPLPPSLASSRVSPLAAGGAGAGATGPYDHVLDVLRVGPLAADAAPAARRTLEGDAGAGGSPGGSLSAPLEPLRLNGAPGAPLAMPRPKRLADVRASVMNGMGSGGAGGGSWPLPLPP